VKEILENCEGQNKRISILEKDKRKCLKLKEELLERFREDKKKK